MVHLPTYGGFSYFERPADAELQRLNETRLIRLSDHIVAPSRFAADLICRTHRVIPSEISVIHPGVEPLANHKIDGAPVDRQLRIVWHGRFTLQKGMHELVDVLDELQAERYQISIAGRAIDSRFKNLFHEGGAQILGQLSEFEIERLLADADVILSTSLHETFGFSVLEGMSSGSVPVAFDVGSLNELVTDGVSGILVAPIDPASLARKIEILDDDRAMLRELSKAAKAVANEFSWERHVERLSGVFQ
jgi:glycosyltransferase involved in cell wall biosynthesis